MVKIFDLSKGKYIAEYSCNPRSAIIVAHAYFIMHDSNTWEYEEKYGYLVEETKKCFTIGNLTVLK